ncbi:MAG: SIS domain-containing protein [Bacilli bacterium]
MGNLNLKKVKNIVESVLKSNKIENVVFVGCGASKSELYPAKYFLNDASKKLRVAHYTASEFNYDTPCWLAKNTVVISASLGGTTPETIEANSVAKKHGAIVISLTNVEGSGLLKEADYSIVHGFSENYAAKLEKMSYAIMLAVEILNQVEGYEHYDLMVEGFNKIFTLAEDSAHMAVGSAKKFAEKYKDVDILYFMSSGASTEVAYSSSICLTLEMQWINSSNFHTGEYFHGPFEITEKDVPFVLMMNDGKTRKIDTRAQDFLHRFDALTAIIDAKDYGLSAHINPKVCTYFNPLIHTAVFRVYAEELSYIRRHPLTKRRYMWKLEY